MDDSAFEREMQARLRYAPGVARVDVVWRMLAAIRKIDANAFRAFAESVALTSKGRARKRPRNSPRQRYADLRKDVLHAALFADWLMDVRRERTVAPFLRKNAAALTDERSMRAAAEQARSFPSAAQHAQAKGARRKRGRQRPIGELSVKKWLDDNAARVERMGLPKLDGKAFRDLEKLYHEDRQFQKLVLARLRVGRRNGAQMLPEDYENRAEFNRRYSNAAQTISLLMIRK